MIFAYKTYQSSPLDKEDSDMDNVNKRKELVDRRQHERFQVHDGAFVVLRPRSPILGQDVDIVGQIMDISKTGLVLRYVASQERSYESFELDIVLAGNGFRLNGVPVKTVSDCQMPDDAPSNSTTVRRRGVQFRALTDQQTSQLERFIQDHTNGHRWVSHPGPVKGQGEKEPAQLGI
jgi:hypothetical protein